MDLLIKLLIYIAVFAIAFIVIFYLLKEFALPEPINKIVRIVLIVIAGVVAIVILLQAGGIARLGRVESVPAPYQVGNVNADGAWRG